jgi:hypothetical protein
LPAPAAAHADEIGHQIIELGGVADRVAADDGEPKPGAVGDCRGLVGVEVIALARVHGKGRQRILTRGIDQRPHPLQQLRLRSRRGRQHEREAAAGDQNVAERSKRQEVRIQPRADSSGGNHRVPGGHRPAKENAARDQRDRDK